MKVFKRDYVIRKGSTFSISILLSDIWVSLNPLLTYTTKGGMSYVSDSDSAVAMTVSLSENNTKMAASISAATTAGIENVGNYNYAIDIINSGVVQTIMEGIILVKEDMSGS